MNNICYFQRWHYTTIAGMWWFEIKGNVCILILCNARIKHPLINFEVVSACMLQENYWHVIDSLQGNLCVAQSNTLLASIASTDPRIHKNRDLCTMCIFNTYTSVLNSWLIITLIKYSQMFLKYVSNIARVV